MAVGVTGDGWALDRFHSLEGVAYGRGGPDAIPRADGISRHVPEHRHAPGSKAERPALIWRNEKHAVCRVPYR